MSKVHKAFDAGVLQGIRDASMKLAEDIGLDPAEVEADIIEKLQAAEAEGEGDPEAEAAAAEKEEA